MARDHSWYRRTTWTAADRAEFEERNRRSRGANSKAQYIRIQADTLRKTGSPDLTRAALELLESSFRDYPNAMDSALAYECAGRCCETLDDLDAAIEYYLSALRREQAFPGIGSNACFRLALLAVAQGRTSLYDAVLAGIERRGRPVFAFEALYLNAVKAVVAVQRADLDGAREFARSALRSAAAATASADSPSDLRSALLERMRVLAGTSC